jgi:hypothetical protein
MYLIMISVYCLTLAAGALLYRYITERREARKRGKQRPF